MCSTIDQRSRRSRSGRRWRFPMPPANGGPAPPSTTPAPGSAGPAGWPSIRCRAGAAVLAPTFEAAHEIEPWLTRLAYRRFRHLREIESEIQLYHQRKVFAASAELTFQMLHGDSPLTSVAAHDRWPARAAEAGRGPHPRHHPAVNSARLRGVGFRHLVEAAALLWTARRISGRVLSRIPVDPEWNDSASAWSTCADSASQPASQPGGPADLPNRDRVGPSTRHATRPAPQGRPFVVENRIPSWDPQWTSDQVVTPSSGS